jgi:hypothetical protein
VINVAKWALLAVLALLILELAVFIAVVAMVGFGWALSLMLAGSLTGLLILRHLGSVHNHPHAGCFGAGKLYCITSRQSWRPGHIRRDSGANSGIYYRFRCSNSAYRTPPPSPECIWRWRRTCPQ